MSIGHTPVCHKVLLVDDEERVLTSLKRCLNQMDDSLQVRTAHDGNEALVLSTHEKFDLIVADLRMPYVDGTRLLSRVRRQNPRAVRAILSGQVTTERLFDVLPVSHLYLEKPCTTQNLQKLLTIVRTASTSRLPPALLTQVLTLTSLPCEGAVHSLLKDMVDCRAADHDIDKLLNADLGIAASVLRVTANTSLTSQLASSFSPSVASLHEDLLQKLLASRLLAPLHEDEELLRTTRLISLKTKLLQYQLKSVGIECSRLLSIIAYLGELALVSCIGSSLELLTLLRPLRDDITKLVGTMWGIPQSILNVLHDADLLGLREEIDAFFPLKDLEWLSSSDVLGMYVEVLCWID